MSAGFRPGVKGYGHSLRRATATECIAGTNPVDGTYVQRACSGGRCVIPILFVAMHRLDDVGGVPRLFRRFVCPHHAERFARRYGLTLPPPLPTDQRLLPFYAEKGEADGSDAHLSL